MTARFTKTGRNAANSGFTLIELLIVTALMAILLSIAVPAYQRHVVKAKEAALGENLFQMRDAIDKYYADTRRYPGTLSDLVEKKYLRKVPVDPFTGSTDTWVTESASSGNGVYDVKSGSDGTGLNGIAYSEW